MTEPTEAQKLELEKWKALYDLSRENFERAQTYWNAIDSRTGQYITLLGVVVATAIFTIDAVLAIASRQHDVRFWLFVGSYFGVWATATASFLFLTASLRFIKTETPAYGEDLVAHFQDHSYVDSIYTMSVRFSEAAKSLRAGR